MLRCPIEDGYKIHKICVKACNNPLKRLFPYTIFFIRAIRIIIKIAPDIIHTQGMDMLKIAVVYKKLFKNQVKIIYEVPDLHRFLLGVKPHFTERIVQKFLLYEDRKNSKEVDLLIVTSQKHIESYFCNFIDLDKILCLPNMPDMSVFDEYKKKDSANNFTIGYIGSIRYKEQIKNLINVAGKCGISVLLAGYENKPEEVYLMCKNLSYVEWFGRFDFKSDAAKLYGKCDVVFSVYDADIENVRMAVPNKLYESIYCQLPIIVAKKTYLSEIVSEMGVGVSVGHRDKDELEYIIKKLRDDKEFYNGIVDKCKQHRDEIDLEKYNQKFVKYISNM